MSYSKRRGRRGDPRTATFFTLHHYVLDSLAFQALSPHAVKVLLRLARRYNGANNGRLAFSVRDAATETGCAFNTARKCFAELQVLGFIAMVTRGGFSLKDRHATEWRLTFMPSQGDGQLVEADKPFMRWRPQTQNADARAASDGRTR